MENQAPLHHRISRHRFTDSPFRSQFQYFQYPLIRVDRHALRFGGELEREGLGAFAQNYFFALWRLVEFEFDFERQPEDGLRLRLLDAQGQFLRVFIPAPDGVELWISRFVNPLLEK